jgi:hypothetical protein
MSLMLKKYAYVSKYPAIYCYVYVVDTYSTIGLKLA